MNRNLPYLPGLDGLRGLAVVAVIVYHADSRWLPGGFLGVEVFFVISGYLITLLLLDEHERSGRIDVRRFYARRARRLLPALFALLILLNVYAAIFRRDALGQIRGDVIAGLTYVSNWYQIWVGQSYTATGDFVPLRHLWSLAVEEQFYVVWPLVMIAVLGHTRRQERHAVGYTFVSIAMAIAAFTALAYRPGQVGTCDTTPSAYWDLAGHCVSRTDVLYLSTPARAGGLLLGAALALILRPSSVGPGRRFLLESVGMLGLGLLTVLIWNDAWLFRGGFLVTGLATVAVITAAAHPTVVGNRLLGTMPLVWIGLRSYGLYLFHWPIFQCVRRIAGNPLTVEQFAVALALTVAITELSYRLLETPIRRRTGLPWRPWLAPGAELGHRLAGIGLAIVFLFAVVSLAAAPLRQNEIALAQEQAEAFVGDPFAAIDRPAVAPPPVAPTSTSSTSTTTQPASTSTSTTVATIAPTSPPTSPPSVPPSTVPAAAPATASPSSPATMLVSTPPSGAPVPDSAPSQSIAAAPATPAAVPGPCDATVIERYALGDSVMVGAAEQLSAAAFCVDAAQSRFFDEGLDRIARLVAEGRLGSTVVVSLGTNGLIDPLDLQQMMGALSTVQRVIVVTAKADRPWVAPSNELLRALPATYPNVVVVDWEWAAGSCPGSCFWDDGIHLRPDGRVFYAQLIVDASAS